jgi:hypothetical protein
MRSLLNYSEHCRSEASARQQSRVFALLNRPLENIVLHAFSIRFSRAFFYLFEMMTPSVNSFLYVYILYHRNSLNSAMLDIDHVKELYVNMCTEKDVLEKKLTEDKAVLSLKLQEVKVKLQGSYRQGEDSDKVCVYRQGEDSDKVCVL